MSSFEHIAESKITIKSTEIKSPPDLPIGTNEELIRDATYRSTRFTIKYIRVCEFSGEEFPEESDSLVEKQLTGAKYISDHHCFGYVTFNKILTEDFEAANILFEIDWKIIQTHSLQGKTIKIKRSSGVFQDAIIPEDSPLRYIDDYNDFLIKVAFEQDGCTLYKGIPLYSYEKNGKKVPGILELNPHLIDEDLVLDITSRVHPEWIIDEKREWLDFIKDKLSKTPFNIIYK